MRSSASCCLSSNWRKKVKRILFKKKYWKDKKIPTNSALNKINFQFTFSMVANFQYQIIKNWISGNNFFQSHNFAFSTGFLNCIFTIPRPFSLDFLYHFYLPNWGSKNFPQLTLKNLNRRSFMCSTFLLNFLF